MLAVGRKNAKEIRYHRNGGTYLVLMLLKRNKGKVITGTQIQGMLSRHGKGPNYHAVQRLVLDGYAKRLDPGRYIWTGKE